MTESRKSLKSHEVQRELLNEQSPQLLHELHLLTRDGALNADARRKLKQVNHLYNLIKPALDDIFERHPQVSIVDVGAGKAYLGFIIYQLALRERSAPDRLISIEERPELMEKAEAMAKRLGFSGMTFAQTKVNAFDPPERVHLLTALHACDTATDDALLLGLRARADYMAVVPCCQAEVAQLLKGAKTAPLNEIWSHGIHRREFGSHLTNVMRALVLESKGYAVTVTELVGWEHSLKNEFILAKRVQNQNPQAEKRLRALIEEIGIRPKLVRELFGV